ncbi:MAG TPA: sugar ABC transporter permease [Spirochaetes bacterium]|nr:sugar ABC transporter permease [Spirochaetota bacterium]
MDRDTYASREITQLKKGWLSYKQKKRITPWLFVAPCILIILLVTIFPTIYSFGLSLTKWEISLPDRPFIGLGNYTALIRDARFRNSILITAVLVVVGVGVEMLLGFGLGQILSVKMKGKRIIVAALLLPVMVMPIVVGYTWRLLWDAMYGPINQIIGWIIGRPFQIAWLAKTPTAIFAILVTEIWQWTPFMFLVFLSGIVSLDTEIFEAADIDGASSWEKLRFMTIPLLRPIIIVALLIRGLDALKFFDVIFALTGGAPGNSTETISFYIYKTGYQFFRLGYGAAASFILLIALIIIITYLLKIFKTVTE